MTELELNINVPRHYLGYKIDKLIILIKINALLMTDVGITEILSLKHYSTQSAIIANTGIKWSIFG